MKYKDKVHDLESLIKEELNVKEIIYSSNVSDYMNYEVKPNFKLAGPVFGKSVGKFAQYLQKSDKAKLIEEIENKDLDIDLDGQTYTINKNYLDIRVSAKDGYDVQVENGVYVLLDTVLTDDLINEGYAREFISKVQQERKRLDLNISDRIEIKYEANDDFSNALDKYTEEIMSETLAVELNRDALDVEAVDMNDNMVKFKIEVSK